MTFRLWFGELETFCGDESNLLTGDIGLALDEASAQFEPAAGLTDYYFYTL